MENVAALRVEISRKADESILDIADAAMRRLAMNDDDRQIEEFLRYTRLHWRVAAQHNVHPSELTKDYLDPLIAKHQRDFEEACARRGEPITPKAEYDAMVQRTRDFAKKVAGR